MTADPSQPDPPSRDAARADPADDAARETNSQFNTIDAALSVPDASAAGTVPADVHRALPDRIGRYRIVRCLGGGGMGIVYEAVGEGELRVALKTLRLDRQAPLSRFIQEFHSLIDLRHDNLVRIFELVTDGETPFYTMELVDGLEFTAYVTGRPTDSVTDRRRRLRDGLAQLVEALDFVHRAGQIHRDMKPSNVLVAGTGQVKILDFGLAAELGRSGRHTASVPGAAVGTYAYMAPEQAEGRDVSPAADWYSVGVLLYECLTGRLPFDCSNLFQLQQQKMQGNIRLLDETTDAELSAMCRQLLHPDPRHRPTADQLRGQLGVSRCKPTVSQIPLVGRSSHLKQMHAALRQTITRQLAQVLLIQGRSGMGKSEVARRFLDEVEAEQLADVYRGRCYQSVFSAFKAFEAIAATISRRLQQLPETDRRAVAPLETATLCEVFPVFREVFRPHKSSPTVSAQERRSRAFEAFRELLNRMGPTGPLPQALPLVLFIDDLQWGDLDSIALMAELLRPPSPPPCLLLCAFRSEDLESSPCLQAVFAGGTTARGWGSHVPVQMLEVGPLDEAESVELARAELLDFGGTVALAESIARESRGSPLFVLELVRWCGSNTELAPSEIACRGISLEQVIWQGYDQLPTDQQQVMQYVAAAGCPIRQAVIRAAAGLVREDPALVDGLVGKRMLRLVGAADASQLDTYHDRIRETLLDRLPPDELAERHRRLAVQMEAFPGHDPELVARQFFAGGQISRASDFYRTAALRAAESLAFDQAARLYRAALDTSAADASDRHHLTVQLADALANAGRCAEAGDYYLLAARDADPQQAVDLRRLAALRYLTSGHVPQGLDSLRAALTAVRLRLPASPLQSLASLLWWRFRVRLRGLDCQINSSTASPADLQRLDVCWSAVAGLSLVDPMKAAAFVARNLWLALRAGEPQRLLRALTVHTSHVAIAGLSSRRAVERLLAKARDVADQMSGAYPQAVVALSEGIVAHLYGQWRTAWEKCDFAVQLLLDGGARDVAWELATARTFAMWAMYYAGQAAELARRQPKLQREAADRDDLYGRINFGTTIMMCVQLAADQVDDAARLLDEDDRRLARNGFHVQHHNAMLARVALDLYRGQPRQAWQLVSSGWRRYQTSMLGRVEQVRIDFLQVQGRAALAAAQADAAQRANLLTSARRIARRLRRQTAPWSHAMATLVEAGADRLAGNTAHARNGYRRAIDQLDDVEMQLFAAAARCRLADLVEGRQQSELAAAAQNVFDQQGVVNVVRTQQLLAP